MAALTISTGPLVSLTYDMTSTWSDYGDPFVNISGQKIPNEIVVQQVLCPSGLELVEADIYTIFEDAYNNNNNPANNDFIANSGCHYTWMTGNSQAPLAGQFYLTEDDENSVFDYSYGIRYIGEEAQNIYALSITANDMQVTTMASQPRLNNIAIEASGVAVSNTDTRLWMNYYHGHELVNPSEGASRYEIYIEDKNTPPSGYSISGVPNITGFIPSSNILHSGDFFVDLPFTHVNANNTVTKTNYFLTIQYYNQDDIPTKYIKFHTDQLQTFNDDFEDGLDFPVEQEVEFKEIDKLFDIDVDISEKRRLVLDVSDIYLESNEYQRVGKYTSKYYNIDIPLYSISLVANDYFPSNINKDSIKYYIQLGQLPRIRISPTNHEAEFIYDNGIKTQISKLLVLDKLDLQTIANVSEVNANAPIYSFRVIIDFNITFSDGTNSAYFIPPFIDSYECHITDTQSYLRT